MKTLATLLLAAIAAAPFTASADSCSAGVCTSTLQVTVPSPAATHGICTFDVYGNAHCS